MQQLTTEIIVLCDYASISREGKLSINGIFEELRVLKFPVGLARAFFVATISGTPNASYKLDLKIEPAKGFTGEQNTFNLETPTGPNGRANMVVELAGLGFKEEGDYNFILSEGKKELGKVSLKVMDQNKYSISDIKLPN